MKKLILAILIMTSTSALASNDPSGRMIAGMGIERLSVQGCGKQRDIAIVTSGTQGLDTFDIQYKFLQVDIFGNTSWLNLWQTGSYGWLKNVAYMTMDTTSKNELLTFLQIRVNALCGIDRPINGRSLVVLRNQLKITSKGRLSGVLQVKADGINYTLITKGGLQ